ncbi:uncharacterized protein LOC111333042 [Stylophora pistillata]|uniref:uncharacterized protein LOC111333042 n=1 Tax=Stylophora pistillata TaxID=50429 RepID=UPI000C040D5B|nr:uncharacterized protein LOC111333042 [Stylophora pistillata]
MNMSASLTIQLVFMALGVLIMNCSIQVEARPKVPSVSLLHGMINSSEKNNINTRQEQREIRSAKSEKEKTTDSTSVIQEEHATAEQFKTSFPKSTKDNECIKKYDQRLIYNYFFAIPHCKKGCKEKFRFVSFSNGKTLSMVYDCFK